MEFSAEQIAGILEGTTEGNPDVLVDSFAKIEEGKERNLSFLANPKYKQYLYTTEASVVIVNKNLAIEKEVKPTLVRVDDAYQSFARLLNYYNSLKSQKLGIEEPSHIDKSAKLGENLYVGAFAYIGKDVEIGDNVKIYPHVYIGDNVKIASNSVLYSGVKVYHDCIIGKDCTLHGGVIIGGDGFGFAPDSNKSYSKIAQIGNVIIEDAVEIGANSTIDRATMGSTYIRKGVKLDNMIQVAHNVDIGENTVIAAQTGIAGSAKIGKNCMIGGHVAINGHITIADEVKIGAKAGVLSDVKKKGEVVQGFLAFKFKDFMKSYVLFRKLPKLADRIANLESKQKELNEQ